MKVFDPESFERLVSKLKDNIKEICDSTDDINTVYEKICELLDILDSNFKKLNHLKE